MGKEVVTMNPLVSILIPTYNRADIIGETLESALSQTHSNIEVIVTDNASTDETFSIVQKMASQDPRIKAFRNETNLGPVLNWQACLGKASGEYVKILWSDDLMAPEFLEKTVAMYATHPDLAFVFTKARIGEHPDDTGTVHGAFLGATGIYPSSEFIWGIVGRKGFPSSPGCALFKTEILKKSFVMENEMFENRYLENGAGPDLLMFLMATTRSDRLGYINEDLSFFRAHEGSISISEGRHRLRLDYAKAIIWFLYHHVSRDIAQYYWFYISKDMQGRDAGAKKELSTQSLGFKCMKLRDVPYVLRICFMKPKRYLAWLYKSKDSAYSQLEIR